ncbi:protein LSM12-like [Tropilaelaps mercedesae]|uniref:Protein LSM12-like n=1 Tax=Tropilaelaps mercedesae TaxID=418985 RepID=A0A1V9XTB8_9ACAR|nr:protein LSM12-like [Tropilaelaps mercedesae]
MEAKPSNSVPPRNLRAVSPSDVVFSHEVFQRGSVVSVETPFNDRFQGEVVAFDEANKALLLKSSSIGQNQRKTTDVRMVNMAYVTNVTIEMEASTHDGPRAPPVHVNIEKISSRMAKHADERRKMAAAIAGGVSAEGISLFIAVRKTIEEVSWQGKDIMVMNSVRIQPPYRPENCVPVSRLHAVGKQPVAHIQKIVEKHLNDVQREQGKLATGAISRSHSTGRKAGQQSRYVRSDSTGKY